MPGSRPTLAERRAATRERRRRAARRRLVVLVSALVVLVVAGAAAAAAIRHDGKQHASTTTTTSPGRTSTSTSTVPSAPKRFAVGLHTIRFVDHSRSTVSPAGGAPIPGRVLETDVLYPTRSASGAGPATNAAPAVRYGPFPLVVFAHGFDVSPSYYFPLLETWVRAGFVVVAPVFPDENTATVNANGGPSDQTTVAHVEEDVPNEPGDLVFVLRQLGPVFRRSAHDFLAGLADTADLALVGQSDGANAVAALGFGSGYTALRHALPHKEKAVIILSGAALFAGPGGVGSSLPFSSPASPRFLQVQSDADTCNLASSAAGLFARLGHAPLHLFEMLHGASHLEPYTDLDLPNAYAPVVDKVTTEFLELELSWRDSGISLASIERAGDVPSLSSLSSTLSSAQYASSPTALACTGLPVVSAST